MWTHQDRKVVAELILAGLSAREIGAEFHLTRNAVIGRVHRDPALARILSRRGYPKRKPKPPPDPIKPEKPFRPRMPVARKPVAVMVTDDFGGWEEREAFQSRKPKPLLKLKSHECRWPVFDAAHVVGGFLFCAEATDGGSYCRHHQERARP
jgi:GcrA cell cycle regulator